MDTCLLCRKHKGQEVASPGGYIYEDEHWMICHAQPHMGPLGTLFIESKRHFLDYAEMTDEESASLGNVMRRIYDALKTHTAAERIYQVTLIDGIPHFHTWLVPRRREDTEKGMKFLTRDDSCNEADAIALTSKLRKAMK
jgi:diadenosine tetraphosphate (Ap4A) HIT family hydrolase